MDALSLAASATSTPPDAPKAETPATPATPVEIAKTSAAAAIAVTAVVTDPSLTVEQKVNTAVAVGAAVAEKFVPPHLAALIELAAMSEPYMVSLVSALLHLHKKAHK